MVDGGDSNSLPQPVDREKMFKYYEDLVNVEVMNHIASTYGQHYVGRGTQVQDLLIATDRAEGFYIGSIIKYAARYGKKNGKNPVDILKAIHFLYLLYSLNHLEKEDVSLHKEF